MVCIDVGRSRRGNARLRAEPLLEDPEKERKDSRFGVPMGGVISIYIERALGAAVNGSRE